MDKKVKAILVEKTGLQEHPKDVLSGLLRGYRVSISYETQQNLYYITVNATLAEEPDAELETVLNDMRTQLPGTRSIERKNARIVAVVAHEEPKEQAGEQVASVLTHLIEYLQQRGYVTCCGYCGRTDVSARLSSIDDDYDYLCDSCYQKVGQELSASHEESRKKGNLATGIVGAFLGALIGAVLWVAIYQFGYIAGIAGFVMTVCALKGYEKFGGTVTRAGVVITMVLVVAMIYFAQNFSLALEIYQAFKAEYPITFSEAYQMIPDVMTDSEISSAFIKDLVVGYGLTALASYSAIRNIFKTASPKGRMKQF